MSQNAEPTVATKTEESVTPATTTETISQPQPESFPKPTETVKDSIPTTSTEVGTPATKTSENTVPNPTEESRPEVKTTAVAWSSTNEPDSSTQTTTTTTTTTKPTKRPQDEEEGEGPNPLGSDIKRTKSDPKKEEVLSTKKKFVFGATTKFGAQAFSATKSSNNNIFGSLSSAGSSSSSNATTTSSAISDENKKEDDSSDLQSSFTDSSASKKATFGSVFGSKSTFGNAFQSAISKKSIFDAVPSKSTKDSTTPASKDKSPSLTMTSEEKTSNTTTESKEVSTGEENETQQFTCRAKLYSLSLKEVSGGWKERGVGSLHVNKSKDSTTIPNRVIMRSNGLMNVILNVKIDDKMQLSKGFQGSLQSKKFITFNGVEGDEVVRFAVKVGKEEVCDELFQAIEALMK